MRYQERSEYHLTRAGHTLMPALAALQEWGDTWLVGDGRVVAGPTPAEERRVAALVGTAVPPLDPDPLEPDLLRGRRAHRRLLLPGRRPART